MSTASRVTLLIGFEITSAILGLVAISLRLVAIQISRRSVHWHDVCCIASYIFLVILVVLSLIRAYAGLHSDANQVSFDQVSITAKMAITACFAYNAATCFMRLSILLLYLTFFRQRAFRHLAFSLGAFVVLSCLGVSIYYFWLCKPLSKLWNQNEKGSCGSPAFYQSASAIINMFLDGFTIMLPLPLVWRLNLPVRKRLVVCGIFCLGIITIGVNISRLVVQLVLRGDQYSRTQPIARLLITAEILAGIFVACIPTLGPIFKIESFRTSSHQPKTPCLQAQRAIEAHRDVAVEDEEPFEANDEENARPQDGQHEPANASMGFENKLKDNDLGARVVEMQGARTSSHS